jgi:hypothetical protein
MTHGLRSGRRPIAAAAAVLFITGALLLVALGGARQVGATAHHDHAVTATATSTATAKARALHDGMRRLWEDHIVWTRMAIVSFAAGLPDFDDTAARLLRNQSDIGNAIKPFYGRRAGDRLTALLKEHITGAVALLQAAKAGDAARLEAARAAWYANGDQIAAFLSRANPRSWRATMRSMMREHLDDTIVEAVARLEGRYGDDIRAYDRIHRHILMMADALSAGIVKQFPRRFR